MFRRHTHPHDAPHALEPGHPSADPHGPARDLMIEHQLRRRGVVMHSVLEAMRTIPRHHFVAHEFTDRAYADEALPSVHGQTISQPFIVALMTQELQLRPGQRVLELGTGTGYQTALLAHLVSDSRPDDRTLPPDQIAPQDAAASGHGAVYTIERVPELSQFAQHRLAALLIQNVHFHIGDGSLGWPRDDRDGPRSPEGDRQFDRIIVTAGAPEIPAPLLRQLAPNGILIAPIGASDSQTLTRFRRHNHHLETTPLLECRFVPLVGTYAWDPATLDRLTQEKSDPPR